MRPSVLAVSLTVALLLPGAAALADPPWKRDGAYEAGGCKYEYKREPHGFKEESKCEGGPEYRGGPPPWAPAHGWRRKQAGYHRGARGHEHDPRDEVEYSVVDIGIELGRCNREVIGAVIGGAAGGAIGAQVGKGSDRTVATIGGTIIGVLIGGTIGRSMDEADQACVAQSLERAPARHEVAWSSADGAHYRVVPLEVYEGREGSVCRGYRTTAIVGGRQRRAYGTACRQPDGSWQRVS